MTRSYFDEGNAYVYVAQDGTAVRTEVTVGLYTADTIAVTSGLTAGDEVITTWSAGLKDGAPHPPGRTGGSGRYR